MINPHPPLFPVELEKKDCDDTVSAYVNRIVEPIFLKVLQETPKNLLMGGGRGSEKNKIALYSPHNYRLYIDFSKDNFNPKPYIKPSLKSVGVVTYERLNNGHEHKYDNFLGCSIRVKKNQIEIQNKIEHKRSYSIEISENAKNQIIDIIKKKDSECIEALKTFISIYGGSSNYKILKRTSEDKVFGTSSINSIPIKEKFHSQIVKKVYNEPNVEFYDPVFAVNHLINSGVVEVVPSLVECLDNLSYNINPLRTVKTLIHNFDDIFKYSKLINILSKQEKKELETWINDKFNLLTN